MGAGGARPNAGRKKKNTELVWMRVESEVAEAIRSYAKEKKVTMAEAVTAILTKPAEK